MEGSTARKLTHLPGGKIRPDPYAKPPSNNCKSRRRSEGAAIRAIGERIATERIRLGLTRREAAKLLKMSPTNFSNWERGHCYPPTPILIRMCDLFGCTADFILFGD